MSEKAEKKQLLPWIIIGLLVVVLIGGGIYVYRDLHQSQSASATTGQNANGANRGRQANPAMRAAMSLLRLQQDPKVALTADQKAKLIPLVQELKATANPSQQFSQDKATAIEQVLTDDQKTFLNQRPNGQGNGQGSGQGNWNGQQGSGQGQWGGRSQQGSGQAQDGGQRPQGSGNGQFNQSDLYDRVLKALQ